MCTVIGVMHDFFQDFQVNYFGKLVAVSKSYCSTMVSFQVDIDGVCVAVFGE